MNGYFIHTIELNKNITYKELEKIKDNLHCFPKNKGSKNYSWRSTHYKSSGIIIDIHKRTNREMFSGDYDKNYNLKLFINPSRLLVEDTYTNKIHIFYRVFFAPSLCYVSDELLKTIIRDSYKKKYSKIIKMLGFANLVRSGEGKTIDDALNEMDCSDKVRSKLLSYFDKIKLSPLNIRDKNIHFLQSLESILEMCEPSQLEKEYYELAVEASDDIPYFHEQCNSSTDKDVFARFE